MAKRKKLRQKKSTNKTVTVQKLLLISAILQLIKSIIDLIKDLTN